MLSDRLSLVGREREFTVVRDFLDGENVGPRLLVLEGPAGIGKTRLWEAGLRAAGAQGMTVLSSRLSTEDAALDFVGLADVFAGVHLDQLDALPAPQRRALEVALLLRDSHAESDSRAVFTAVRTAFGVLARESKLIVAIDDVQWLDRASASALAFAARRLGGGEICFLLTERLDPARSGPGPLERGLDVERLAIAPLSYGAITTMLHERLGLTLTRPVARRLHDRSGGNPLFALELARALEGSGAFGEAAHELPLPSKVQDALAHRVAALTAAARRALLAASLSPGATAAELIAVAGERAVDSAIDAGVLVLDAERVRPSHPLIGEVARARADAGALRGLHRRMAAAAHDEGRRALHLSLGTLGKDGSIAEVVATAAAAAARRGASGTAADLGRRALELTPRTAPEWVGRLLDAAEYDYAAGELVRATRLLEPELDRLPAGPLRARALYVLAVVGKVDAKDVYGMFEQALDAAAEPTLLRARILTHFARDIAIGQVRSPAEAEARASQAIEICRRCQNPRQERHALVSLMWARALGGHRIDDLLERHAALAGAPFSPYDSAERITALTKLWRGELGPARTQFEWLLSQADERGETEGYFAIRLQLCELELRAGRWDRVSAFLDEWAQERGEMIGHQTAYLRCRAHLAAGKGDAAEAMRLADEAIAADRTVGVPWHRLESLRARGIGALLAGDPRAACESLESVESHLRAEGIVNPGPFPIDVELAEALSLTGSLARAREVANGLAARSRIQDNPWGAAAAARAFGHVALAERDHTGARELFADAADRFGALELAFERARSLVGLGVAQRRMRSKREARVSFDEAVAEFERLGSPGWSGWASGELARLGGRAPSGGRLTPTERRVAELVAQGMGNKQVAAAMVVTDRTIEAHLTRIYAKLGVRSRTELARRLSGSR